MCRSSRRQPNIGSVRDRRNGVNPRLAPQGRLATQFRRLLAHQKGLLRGNTHRFVALGHRQLDAETSRSRDRD
jgi:hypothetical protein